MLEARGGSPIHKGSPHYRTPVGAERCPDYSARCPPPGAQHFAASPSSSGKSCKARATRRRSSVTRGVAQHARRRFTPGGGECALECILLLGCVHLALYLREGPVRWCAVVLGQAVGDDVPRRRWARQ